MKKIRVFLDSQQKTSGPGVFMARIAHALDKTGKVEITSKKPHIALGTINLPRVNCKRVIRVDGCYYNKSQGNMGINNILYISIVKSDGVIFQSQFSKLMCEQLLKVEPQTYSVIHNGIDKSWIDEIPAIQNTAKNVFVAIANWRNSKRPKSIINGFLEAKIPDSQLLFIGKYKYDNPSENVLFLGDQSPKKVISYLKGATSLIHICKIESCSNAVVEALACGKPVVCNNIGGTPEIVGSDGVIVKCDDDFEFRVIKEKDVDNINVSILSEGLNKIVSRSWEVSRPELNMDNVAQQYYDFFLRVLK